MVFNDVITEYVKNTLTYMYARMCVWCFGCKLTRKMMNVNYFGLDCWFRNGYWLWRPSEGKGLFVICSLIYEPKSDRAKNATIKKFFHSRMQLLSLFLNILISL